MNTWSPHITVATIVPSPTNDTFLFVEELDNGQTVINQPAGHLEANESLVEAAIRETYEETGWHVKVSHFLGIALYEAANGITYQRNTFLAKVIEHDKNAILDEDIIQPVWLSYEQLLQQKAKWRSPLVKSSLQQYLNGYIFPLTAMYS